MTAIQNIQQYLDTAYQRIETWKAEQPNHTQEELEAVSNTMYDQAYREYSAASNTLSEGPRMDYLRMNTLEDDSHV